ncbi:MAG: hypothetical protein AMJ53_07195 [Gammaproteobacteria bacterium SG8_11]|nr:MAG: hypothetical protein AMJ53_07195 [Gammaproteobacteria bacterium SG8_11]
MSTSTSYLKRFLQTIAVLHIIAGLCFPWIVESPLFDHYREHLHLAFNVQNFNAQQQALFLMALFGPTIASWGVLFLFAINFGFARPSPQAWIFLLLACLAWAPYDSILSLQHGVYLNAIINAVVFVIIILPLVMVKNHFFCTRHAE